MDHNHFLLLLRQDIETKKKIINSIFLLNISVSVCMYVFMYVGCSRARYGVCYCFYL
jgi:hypothetical protein